MEHKAQDEQDLATHDGFSLWGQFKNFLHTQSQARVQNTQVQDPEEVPVAEEVPEVPEDFLLELWGIWNRSQPEAQEQDHLYLALPEETGSGEDLWVFTKELQGIAKYIMIQIAAAEPENPASAVVDATAKAYTAKNGMHSWLFLFPPQNGGAEATPEMIRKELESCGILYGIEEEMVKKATASRLYFQMLLIAKGLEPEHGVDGEVVEHIPREARVEFKEDEQGGVDFKDLNLIRPIDKDVAICDVIRPTKGVNGCDVKGKTLAANQGRMPPIPQGPNTVLSPEGDKLLSAIDGHVIYTGHKFNVQPLLMIRGDVDNATGNLDFKGDILITGDVREGFAVKADGNVTVRGMVEGASIFAGGDIIISRGMSGGGKGALESKSRIKCRYLENCAVYARERVYSESIICSTVFCDGSVQVLSGRGVIVGGRLTVARQVEAKRIGNQKSGMTTILQLGNRPDIMEEKNTTEEQLSDTFRSLEELKQSYPEGKGITLPTDIKVAETFLEEERVRLAQKLEKIKEKIFDISTCVVQGGSIYPITRIIIGRSSTVVHETQNRCRVHYVEGKVVLDTF